MRERERVRERATTEELREGRRRLMNDGKRVSEREKYGASERNDRVLYYSTLHYGTTTGSAAAAAVVRIIVVARFPTAYSVAMHKAVEVVVVAAAAYQ